LFARLPAKGHELVVFDVNRETVLSSLIAPGPKRRFDKMAAAPALPFRLTVVRNRSKGSSEVVAWTREAGALVLPFGQLARVRSNPFFPGIIDRIDAAVTADAQ
jgi:hypothetical protein